MWTDPSTDFQMNLVSGRSSNRAKGWWRLSPRLSRVEALDPTLEGAELLEGEHEDAMTDPIVIIQVTLPVAEGSPSDHSQATGRRVS